MGSDELKMRVQSLLRKAGLSQTPRPVLVAVAVLSVALIGMATLQFWPAGQQEQASFAIASERQGASDDAGASGNDAAAAEESLGASGQVTVSGAAPDAGAQSAKALDETVPEELVVDVEGAVANPGLASVPAQARVGDAIEKAGGFTKKADRSSVNLAQRVQDGQQIIVLEAGKAGQAASAGMPAGKAQDSAGPSGGAGGLVNLNTASAEELQTLPGIGPALSSRIVEYREKNGPFQSVDALTSVAGIGATRLESLRDAVCV